MHNPKVEPLLSQQEAAYADLHTQTALGISEQTLMERAGLALFETAKTLLPNVADKKMRILVLCGPGNNGGDGYVCARRLWEDGYAPVTISFSALSQLKNEAKSAYESFIHTASHWGWTPLAQQKLLAEHTAESFGSLLQQYKPHVIIDALFGTGLNRPLAPIFDQAIQLTNRYRLEHPETKVLAIDLPSGISADGKLWATDALKADVTLSIFQKKIAAFSEPHWLSFGHIMLADIGLCTDHKSKHFGLAAQEQPLLAWLLPLVATSHKGMLSHVGILEGSAGLSGASHLAARSALRSGAAKVTLLVDVPAPQPDFPEIMQKSPKDGAIYKHLDAVVVGPGVLEDAHHQERAWRVVTSAMQHQLPILLDGGGLLLLSRLGKCSQGQVVIATPHPKEAAKILGWHTIEVQSERLRATQHLLALSEQFEGRLIWVLKGACPIVADRHRGILFCEGGVSTLSIGGSGDVLAGAVAALLKRTHDPFEASALAVSAHLAAGRWLQKDATAGHLASEIADALQIVLFGNTK